MRAVVFVVLRGGRAAAASAVRIELRRDGVHNLFNFVLLLFKVFLRCGGAVRVEPVNLGLDEILERLLVFVRQLLAELRIIINLILDGEEIILKPILGFDALQINTPQNQNKPP